MKNLTLAGLVLAISLCGLHPARAQVSGQRVFESNSSVHISTSTTTTIVTGPPHILVSVCINTKGASSNVATIKDGASGATIAVIDTTVTYGCLTYNAALAVGLSIVTATGTPADITVTYR